MAEIQGHYPAGIETIVCVRFNYDYDWSIPYVGTANGYDRRRTSNSTYTVVYDIYETGTVNWEIGLASTMAIVFAFFVMILTVIQTIATRDKEDQNVNKKAKKK